MASVWAHEHKSAQRMRGSFVRYKMRFPFSADPADAKVALAAISGISSRMECVFEVTLTSEGVRHWLLVPRAVRDAVTSAFVGALPGLRLSAEEADQDGEAVALDVTVRELAALSSDAPESTLPILAALSLAPDERVSVRWTIAPDTPPKPRGGEQRTSADKEAERIWRDKTALPTFKVQGLVLVQAAGTARVRALAEHVASLIRSRRRSVDALQLRFRSRPRPLATLPRLSRRRSGYLNSSELLPCLMWSLGGRLTPGVQVGSARELPVPRHVPRQGLRLCLGRDARGERPACVSIEAARSHLALLGGTGSGKSAAMLRLALELLALNFGAILIDPKADLVADLLDRVPASHADRVIELNPAAGGALPGLDLWSGGDPILRSDAILSVLKGISETWGPRIERYLALGLRSVAVLDDPVLSDWLRLYEDVGLRRLAMSRLDAVAVSEWRSYEALSPAEQRQFIAPAAARISGLLARPALRAILNQSSPRLNIARALDERKLVCVSLAPGVLGEPAAHLLGAIVTYLAWSAVEARVAVPQHQRRPVFLLMDELQSLSHLPVGLEKFFERTRGLGCGVVVSTQGLSRLPESARQSLLTNVGSVLAFKAGSEEAARVARELPGLEASDLMGLGKYECAARIATTDAGTSSAVITGRTEPLPPTTGQADAIRATSAARYGRDPREVEAELHRRLAGSETEAQDVPIGRTGRQP